MREGICFMIQRDITLVVAEDKVTKSSEIILYRGDGEITFFFTIVDNRYRYKRSNLVESVNAVMGNAVILKPDGVSCLYTDVCDVNEDYVMVVKITKEMMNEMEEVGTFQMQMCLYDDEVNRLTLPPFNFRIKNGIA